MIRLTHRRVITAISLTVAVLAIGWAEEAYNTAAEGLRGPINTITTTAIDYGNFNGVWRAGTPWVQREAAYDREGRRVVLTEYQNGGVLYEHRECEYHDNGKLQTLTTKRFDYEGNRNTTQITTYGREGELQSDITTNRLSQIIYSWARTENDDGYSIEYYTSSGRGGKDYTETATFDDTGRIIEEVRTYPNSRAEWRRTYTYAPPERLATVTHIYVGAVTGIWRYAYTVNGQLERITHDDAEGNTVSVRTFRYDDGVLAEERSEHAGLDTFDFVWLYLYDRSGNVIRERYTQSATDFSIDTTYEHDSKKRVIDLRMTDTFGRPFESSEYTFDGSDRQTRDVREQKGIVTGYTSEYVYDSEDRMIASTLYDADGSWQSAERFVYDEAGNQVESIELNRDGSYRYMTTYEYEYDDWGNWVSSTQYFSNNQTEQYGIIRQVLERDIAYHSDRES